MYESCAPKRRHLQTKLSLRILPPRQTSIVCNKHRLGSKSYYERMVRYLIRNDLSLSLCSYLPPMTLESPENTLVKLLTTISAHSRTATLQKLPMVSSTTIKNLYSSASLRRRLISGDFSKGLEGNSQNKLKIFSPDFKSASNSSMLSSSPRP